MADDWATTAPVIDAVRSFEQEHPGVLVNVRGINFAQIPEAVQSSITAGDPVDVAQWHAFAAGARGLAEPIDDLWAASLDPAEFFEGALSDVTWGGVRYGVPLDVNALVMLVNPDVLAANGLDLPDDNYTFADVERIAAAVTSESGDVRGVALPASTWVAYGWIRANGGELVEVVDAGRARFSLDAPRVVEALAFLERLVRRGIAFSPASRDVTADAFAAFRAGRTALHLTGTWDAVELQQGDATWIPRMLPLPRGADGSTSGTALGGSSLFVPRGAAHRELAFAFMTHLTSEPFALRLAEEEGRLPPRLAAFDDPLFQRPGFDVAFEQLRAASVMRLLAFPEAQLAFTEAVEKILTGRTGAARALADAQKVATQSASR